MFVSQSLPNNEFGCRADLIERQILPVSEDQEDTSDDDISSEENSADDNSDEGENVEESSEDNEEGEMDEGNSSESRDGSTVEDYGVNTGDYTSAKKRRVE